MKKVLSGLVASILVFLPLEASAKPWMYSGESRVWHWDVSPRRDKTLYVVVHKNNTRWISQHRLRVEFSIRSGQNTGNKYTYDPYTLYDEQGRCDNGAVCDPPIFPVLDYNDPYRFHDADKGNWWTHSVTVDCKDAPRMVWRPTGQGLSMKSICSALRFR